MRKLRQWAKALKSQLYILYLSYQDPRTPLSAKVFAMCVVAYAFSPIDLIPDFIPVLGYVDDMILVPAGIYLAFRMLPQEVLADCRTLAKQQPLQQKPRNWVAAAIIVLLWTGSLILVWHWVQSK